MSRFALMATTSIHSPHSVHTILPWPHHPGQIEQYYHWEAMPPFLA